MRYLSVLTFLFLFGGSYPQACLNTMCRCSSDWSLVSCSGNSIAATVAELRALGNSVVSAVNQITFRNPSERVLPSGTFTNFSSLTVLTICCSRLSRIEPGALDTLNQLVRLDLRDNELDVLSAESLAGTGPLLTSLLLSNNKFVNLRSNLQPIFSSATNLLELQGNRDFTCDCNLRWLVNFVNNANLPLTSIADMLCLLPPQVAGSPIFDSAVDFNVSACTDICSTNYHSCAANASCSVSGDGSENCTCDRGYSGNGYTCDLSDPCVLVTCHHNATCSFDTQGNTSCTCTEGYTGDGVLCSVIDPCQDVQCHSNATCIPDNGNQNGICRCNAGFSGNGTNCMLLDPCQSIQCHSDAVCIPDFQNQNGTCACGEGFTGNGMDCVVLNPCMSSPCHHNASCTASPDNLNAQCVCNKAFTGDGYSCESRCKLVQCHANADCVLDTGMCVCNSGYFGNGFSCTPVVPPCSVCHINATCNSSGLTEPPICTCHLGFTGDGRNCTSVNVFCSRDCGVNAVCTLPSESGSEMCRCIEGYLGDPYIMCVTSESCDQSCGEVGVVCVDGDGPMGTMCVSESVRSLHIQLANIESSEAALLMFTSSLLNATMSSTRSEDLPELVSLFQEALLHLNNPTPATVQNLVDLGSELLNEEKIQMWQIISSSEVVRAAGQLLTSLQAVGHAVFLSSNVTGETVYSSNNVALVVIHPNCSGAEDTVVSSNVLTLGRGGEASLANTGSSKNDSITLPRSVYGEGSDCSAAGLVVVVYDGIGPLLSNNELLPNNTNCSVLPRLAHGQCSWYNDSSCSNQSVEGVVFTASVVTSNTSGGGVRTVDTSMLLEPVRITFEHEPLARDKDPPSCGFLNERQLGVGGESWMTGGCRALEKDSSPTHTVCECYHLTSFAVLINPSRDAVDNRPLQIVSKVGLCISIVCLMLTIILLFTLRLETKHLHQIHRQLAIALCLAQLIFLVGVDRRLVPSPDALCTTIAVLLHYLFLCAFAWQLIEGVHLYLLIVRVFFNEKAVWLYYPLSWGVPAVVVAITVGLKFCDYGSQDFCWINGDNGTNWAFNGPVLAVLVVNVVIMVIVTIKLIRAARSNNEKDTCLLCTLVHASLVLVPILGVGWVLGFFVVGEGAIFDAIEWLFSIFTTLQGTMIFIMHCVLNKDVRKAFLKAIGCHEAAKKQTTVHDMRRTSMAYIRRKSSVGSTKNLRLFNLKKSHTIDSSTMEDSIIAADLMASGFASARKPSITAMSVDLPEQLQNIEEEGSGYSLPNSIPGTPETGSKRDINEATNECEEGSRDPSSENSTHQLISSSTE